MRECLIFVSDVHAQPGNTERASRFCSFLDSLKGTATALYVLGDLFDSWMGRGDGKQPAYRMVIEKLRELSGAGAAVHLLPGNWDFLLDAETARMAGATICRDETRLVLDGSTVLLCHGDGFCVRDHGHQRFSRFLRHPMFPPAYQALPFFVRKSLHWLMRRISRWRTSLKTREQLEMSTHAVERAFASGADVIVCGHTHRIEVRHGQGANSARTLYNLGCWSDNGSYLTYKDGEFSMHQFRW